jgi:hypothetical protein
MKNSLSLFENQTIRRVFNEKNKTWYFSVIDVVKILAGHTDYQTARKYWNKLKERLELEGSQSVTNCHRLKLAASDGKFYLTDVATSETLLRLIQAIPSPKAEPFKLWLAKVGQERLQEIHDPGLAIARARKYYEKLGRSPEWIEERLRGQETRNRLTQYWREHDVDEAREFALLTNIIHEEWAEITIKEHKALKKLKSQNLRDHMNEAELIFTALAELSTRKIAEKEKANGFVPNKKAAIQGGRISRSARITLEKKIRGKVINKDNFLKLK